MATGLQSVSHAVWGALFWECENLGFYVDTGPLEQCALTQVTSSFQSHFLRLWNDVYELDHL